MSNTPLPPEFDDVCITCGAPARVEGDTTKYYVTAYDELQAKLQALEAELAKQKEFRLAMMETMKDAESEVERLKLIADKGLGAIIERDRFKKALEKIADLQRVYLNNSTGYWAEASHSIATKALGGGGEE